MVSTAGPEIQYVYTNEVDLTSAQLLALNTTPVQILPAPQPGMVWVPLRVVMSLAYGTATYSGSGDLYYGTSSSGVTLSSGFGTLLAYTASKVTIASTTVTGATLASVLNQPVYLASGSNPTTGDGTIKLTIAAVQVFI